MKLSPGKVRNLYLGCPSAQTYSATAFTCSGESCAPPIGGMGPR